MISGPVIIDASVAIEYLVNLGNTEQATRLFRRILNDPGVELWAPDLFYPEAVSALRKLVKIGALSRKAGTKAVDNLVRLPVSVVGTAFLVPEMWRLKDFLTAYDACYVALSRSLQAPLITADAKLVRAMSHTKDKVFELQTLV
jgi:predicted nucleic acid-binding protein